TFEQSGEITALAPAVPRAQADNDAPRLSKQVAEVSGNIDQLTQLADVVSQASSLSPASAPLGVARTSTHRPTATATRVAQQASALSAYQGAGPGSRGGPGGRGVGHSRGSGIVQRKFQFGGPSGAFRAEVCFIPETTTSLHEVQGCPSEVTFFTNELNVSPRSFTEGFPGVTTRTEWFAIHYHGSFVVRAGDHYTFRLVSDDGALLYIDGYLIVDNDGQHPPAAKEATVPLAAG